MFCAENISNFGYGYNETTGTIEGVERNKIDGTKLAGKMLQRQINIPKELFMKLSSTRHRESDRQIGKILTDTRVGHTFTGIYF
jgi:hypothetical protein